MKPTERSSAPERSASTSSGATVNTRSAGRSAAPLPVPTTRVPSTTAKARPCSFLPFATTNSTSRSAATAVVRRCADAGEQVVFVFTIGARDVDERTGERVLLPRERLADDVVGEAHPEPGGV